MFRLYTLTLLALGSSVAFASSQYVYPKPTAPSNNGYTYQKPSFGLSTGSGGHFFPPLATIRPLPAVPNLPPLPTARPQSTLHQQALFQSHPPSAGTPPRGTYNPPSAPPSSIGKIVQQYRPSGGQAPAPATTGRSSFGPRGTSAFNPQAPPPSGNGGVIFGSFGPQTGSGVFGPHAPPAAQPLRIPFGKSAVVQYPIQNGAGQQNFGNGGGRPLSQYAVIEIIDNDIMQNTDPFLPPPVRDDFRAQFGASGTGATAPTGGGMQIDSRANANIVEQQRLSGQGSSNNISLGSGGLGLVRLSNGNVHLGSGSLGYISAQMIRDNTNEARNRSEMASAGALHFGHGSLAQSPIGGSNSATTFPQNNRY